MINDLVIVFASMALWLGVGYFIARTVAVSFEVEFGQGNPTNALLLVIFLFGPLSALTLIMSGLTAVKQALGLKEIVTKPFYYIDEPRSQVAEFFLLGVDGLPPVTPKDSRGFPVRSRV